MCVLLVCVVQLLNLALEKQAVGRVYRLGQARPVVVSWWLFCDAVGFVFALFVRTVGDFLCVVDILRREGWC